MMAIRLRKPIVRLAVAVVTMGFPLLGPQIAQLTAQCGATPPTVTPAPGPTPSLWPPNHSYVTIPISDCVASATSTCNGQPIDVSKNSTILRVTSDEPEFGGGDHTCLDAIIAPSNTVLLRAEREGTSNGRVYTIFYAVSDPLNHASTQGSCQVNVPHDQAGPTPSGGACQYCVGTGCGSCPGRNPSCNGPCAPGFSACNGSCVDEQTDPNHCGACNNVCTAPPGATPECSAGACTSSCLAPDLTCGTACVDPLTDPNNCGTCANKCTAPSNGTPECSSGACTFVCTTPDTKCGSACVNTQTDPNNCGACANVCGTVPNGTSVCSSGACGATCNTGFSTCGGSMLCGINLQTNTSDCGACGNVCPTFPNGTAVCSSGSCSETCNTGFATCGGSILCGKNLETDPSNCGACGNVCGPTQTCSAGVCG